MTRGLILLLLAVPGCSWGRPSLESLHSDGYRALQQGDLQTAHALARQGERLARSAQVAAWQRAFTVLEAETLVSERHNTDALALLEKGFSADGAVEPLTVRGLMTRGLGRCFSPESSGDYASAESELEEAARLASQLGSAELSGEVALRRGTCGALQLHNTFAEARFREALAIARRGHFLFLESQATGNLGTLLIQTQHYDDAAESLRQAVRLASELHADNQLAKALCNLGWCYSELGDYDRALAMLGRAEAAAAAHGLTGTRLQALMTSGNTRLRLGEAEAAGEQYRRALVLARELADRRVTARALTSLASISIDQGRYDAAEVHVLDALRIREELKDELGRMYSLVTRGQIRAAREEFAQAEADFREVLSSPQTEPGLLMEAHAAFAQLLVKAGRPADAEAEFQRAASVIEQSRSALREAEHRITFFSSLRRFHDEYVAFLIGQGRPTDALEVADRSRARLLREKLQQNAPLAAAGADAYRRLARTLDATLLSYWTAPRGSYLWIVTPQRIEMRTLPGLDALRADVHSYQQRLLASRDPLEEGSAAGERLYQALIAPAEPFLQPGARVVVVPDGPLHELNFESLVVPGARPHYWIEDVTLASAPSFGLLSGAARTARTQEARLLVIGDAITPTDEFPPLAYAAREIQRITGLFDAADRSVYSGLEAEPSAYRRAEPDRFAFVHFAAHATANRESPLESAVVLSARNDSYKLYAREIVTIPLRAELVTLSACQSAGSRAYAGEGLVGLAWAFLSSGAANVIGGLWNVEDSSTAELMEQLYRGLKAHRDPLSALREAKLQLLRSGSAYRKPFYWAPFVVYTRRPLPAA